MPPHLNAGDLLFPAYAGVILKDAEEKVDELTFPRIRGGDPIGCVIWPSMPVLFPAYAGVIPAE